MDSAVQLCPARAETRGDMAVAYLIRGMYDEGFSIMNEAVKLDSFYYLGIRCWYRLRQLSDYRGALRDLDLLEQVAGHKSVYVTSVHMYMWKGLAEQQLGNPETALAHYNFAIEDQVRVHGDAFVGMYDYLTRGILKLKLGDTEGALEDLTRQISSYETLADTYYYRAVALNKLGRIDEARSDARRAKDLLSGEGQKRWDAFAPTPGEIFLSDVETLLVRLN